MNKSTFQVDDVEIGSDSLSSTTHAKALETLLNGPSEALAAPNLTVVEPIGVHGLVEAVHHAYDAHFPLKLTPDHIWITILQGLARHIEQNPEKYRSMLVGGKPNQTIAIYRPDFTVGSARNNWPSCFNDFSNELRERIGAKNHDLLTVKFGTTGPISQAVQQVALMDTVKSYFNYEVFTDCGIPNVTLEGSAADWQELAAKARALQEFEGLDWWLNHVIVIADQFAAAAAGQPDRDFWREMYKTPWMGSGGTVADGWILKLLPYLKRGSSFERNRLLDGGTSGVSFEQVPLGLSTVPFSFDGAAYELVAGFTAVVQDKDFTVRPGLGWAVRQATQETLEKAGS